MSALWVNIHLTVDRPLHAEYDGRFWLSVAHGCVRGACLCSGASCDLCCGLCWRGAHGEEIDGTSCCLFMVVTNPVTLGPMRNWPPDRSGVGGAVLWGDKLRRRGQKSPESVTCRGVAEEKQCDVSWCWGSKGAPTSEVTSRWAAGVFCKLTPARQKKHHDCFHHEWWTCSFQVLWGHHNWKVSADVPDVEHSKQRTYRCDLPLCWRSTTRTLCSDQAESYTL